MRKKTIAFFFIVSWLLVIISLMMLFGAAFSAANILTAPNPSLVMNGSSIDARLTGTHIVSRVNLGLLSAAIVLLFFAGLLYIISWIGALVAAAKRSSWVWFLWILFFHWFAEMIYLFAGPAVNTPAPAPVKGHEHDTAFRDLHEPAVNIPAPAPVKGHEHDTAFRDLHEPAVVNFLAPTPVRGPKANPFL